MGSRVPEVERPFWDALSASPHEVTAHRDGFFVRHGVTSFAACTHEQLTAYYAELRALIREIAQRRFTNADV
jgi:hypothetical protein